MAERMFPIMGDPVLKAIPWSAIAPHEAQAKRNHGGQSLERLAARGGLSVCEAYAVLFDKEWRRVHIDGARVAVCRAICRPAPAASERTDG